MRALRLRLLASCWLAALPAWAAEGVRVVPGGPLGGPVSEVKVDVSPISIENHSPAAVGLSEAAAPGALAPAVGSTSALPESVGNSGQPAIETSISLLSALPEARGSAPDIQRSLAAPSELLHRATELPPPSESGVRLFGGELEAALEGGADSSRDALVPEEPASPIAASHGAAVLDDFSRNFKLGRDWTPRQPVAPEERALSEALSRKAAELNAEHKSHLDQVLTLMGGLAHDVKNPAGAIQLAVSMLKPHGQSAAPEKTRFIDTIRRGVATIVELSHTFVTLSKLESGRLSLSPEALPVSAFLEGLAKDQELQAKKKEQTVETDVPRSDFAVTADPQILSVIMTNLVANAIKYTPKGGLISLGVARKRGRPVATFFVSDTGIGITPEDQAKILAGGHHRTDAGKKMATGTGIGLHLVQRLLEASGTSLKIESEPGLYSKFYFDLPVAPR